jgi:hypothetical protein
LEGSPSELSGPNVQGPAHLLQKGEMSNVGLVSVSPDSHLLRQTLLEWTEVTKDNNIFVSILSVNFLFYILKIFLNFIFKLIFFFVFSDYFNVLTLKIIFKK